MPELLSSFIRIFSVTYIRVIGPTFLHVDLEDNNQVGRMSRVLLHRLTRKSFRRIGIAVDHIFNQASAIFAFIA